MTKAQDVLDTCTESSVSSEFVTLLTSALGDEVAHAQEVVDNTYHANKHQTLDFDMDKAILDAIQKDSRLSKWYKDRALSAYKNMQK